MATLADLKPSISELPYADAIALIERIRASRRVQKKVTTSGGKRKPARANLDKLTDNMTTEELEKFLKAMEDKLK